MEKYKSRSRRGVGIFILLLSAGWFLCNPACGYAGNIFVETSVLDGATVYLFSASPNQSYDESSPGYLTEGESENYTINTEDYTGYYAYVVHNCSTSRAYILVVTGSQYSILSATLGSTVPTNTYPTATWYTLGSPSTPTDILVNALYETAKASWEIDSVNYQMSGVDLQIATDVGFTSIVAEDDGDTTELGAVEEYTTGQLIDGRTLSPSTNYYLRVRASVSGVADSAWSSGTEFSTLGTPAQTYSLSLESLVDETTGFGINAFSMPFASPWYIDGNQIETAYDLVVEINIAAGSNVVSSFGYWDSENQVVVGVMIDYDSETPNDIASEDVTALDVELLQGVGYQVYVTEDVTDIVISNTSE